MICYVCLAHGQRETPAVAICRGCNAGLCLAHVAEAAHDAGPGGMHLSCSHDTWNVETTRPATSPQAAPGV
jgi:hypothetical protein